MGSRHAKVRARKSAALSLQSGFEQSERVQRGEQLYSNVFNALGAPGTYGDTPTIRGSMGSSSATPGLGGAPADGDIYTKEGVMSFSASSALGGGNASGYRGAWEDLKRDAAKQIDVDKATAVHTSSPQFQMLSRMTAEAAQIAAKEGPAYEKVKNSLQGPIKEAGAKAMSQAMQQLEQDMAATGGSARRQAINNAMQMQQQAEVNFRIYQSIAESNIRLEEWSREIGQQQLSFNQAWTQNLAGVRDSYTAAANAAASYMGQVAVPNYGEFSAAAETMNAKKKGMGSMIAGIASIGAMFIPGVGPLVSAGIMAAGSGYDTMKGA